MLTSPRAEEFGEVKLDIVSLVRELAVQQPRIGCCLLEREIRVSHDVRAASVSNFDLRINPEFWVTLSRPTKKSVLVHEALHVVLGHLSDYFPDLDEFAANVAMDAVINRIIPQDPTLSLESIKHHSVWSDRDTLYVPQGLGLEPLIIEIPGLQKLDWFAIYLQIKDVLKDTDSSLAGYVHLPRTMQEAKQAKQQLSRTLKNSKLTGGYLPSTALEKAWDAHHDKRLDWRHALQSLVVTELGLEEYGTSPNPRTQHLYYSTRRSKTAYPNISVLIDTSGSIDREQLSLFVAYTNQLLVELQAATQLIVFDQEVVTDILVTPPFQINPQNLNLFGNRGTDFRPAFAAVKENSELIVVFTDLHGTYPALAPRQKVVWVSTNQDTLTPWGQVVRVTA